MKNLFWLIFFNIISTSLMATDICTISTDKDDLISLRHENDITGWNNIVDGKKGNDTIKTFEGNDRLYGGKGNDRLEGGVGNDIYYYSLGDGNDTIYDIAGYDSLIFTDGIESTQLDSKFDKNNLIIMIKDKNNNISTITIIDYTLSNGTEKNHLYKKRNNTIESITFHGVLPTQLPKRITAHISRTAQPYKIIDNGKKVVNTYLLLVENKDYIDHNFFLKLHKSSQLKILKPIKKFNIRAGGKRKIILQLCTENKLVKKAETGIRIQVYALDSKKVNTKVYTTFMYPSHN